MFDNHYGFCLWKKDRFLRFNERFWAVFEVWRHVFFCPKFVSEPI